MKYVFFLLCLFSVLKVDAQPYSINFAGTGLSSVKVENLTSGSVINLNQGDVLLLTGTTNISEVENLKSSGIKVYPNPMLDKSTLEFIPPIAGDATVSVCDITGKVLIQNKGYLENHTQEFILSGIKNGLHIINIQGKGYHYSEKLVSNGTSNGLPSIVKLSNTIKVVTDKKSIKDSKGTMASVNMAYTAGERLKYTAVSGNYKTVITDIPTANKTVTFSFTECRDGDNNYYPVVQINTQLWMAENLKTTKFNDGTAIQLVTDITTWAALSTSAYCWYSNDEVSYKSTYGALYNWFVVNTGKICPTGWHVPLDAELTTLTTYLGGESIASSKMKETGTVHWLSPNTGATDETGFKAVPGGYRSYNISYTAMRSTGFWWSSTSSSSNEAWYRDLDCSTSVVRRFETNKTNGLSIRCIKD